MNRKAEDSTRAIVTYWAILVLIGYVCIFQQQYYGEFSTANTDIDMSKVICRSETTAVGTLKEPKIVDEEFVKKNGCNNPCDQINVDSIFRDQGDLKLLSPKEYNESNYWKLDVNSKQHRHAEHVFDVVDIFSAAMVCALPFILVQGIIAVCFGERNPGQVRDWIYIKLYRKHWGQHDFKRSGQWRPKPWPAVTFAILTYVIAILVFIVCPVLFIMQIATFELNPHMKWPDAEKANEIGQWEPWTVAAQAVLAALIARLHRNIKDTIP